jgi:hypothetical protein
MDENIACIRYFYRAQKALSQPQDIFAKVPKGIPMYINKYTLPWFKVLSRPKGSLERLVILAEECKYSTAQISRDRYLN